jgi:V8-like Glu-specific endopeptidase
VQVLRVSLAAVAALVLAAGCGGSEKRTSTGGKGRPAVTSAAVVWDVPHSTQSDVADYWTTERMENAKPVPLPRKEKGSPRPAANPRSPDEGPSLQVPGGLPGGAAPPKLQVPPPVEHTASTRGFPYRRYQWGGSWRVPPAAMWGKVFVDEGQGLSEYCSGTVVASDNKSLVLTAGHCVYSEPGYGRRHWLKRKWVFVPGYHNGKAPYGRWVATRLFTTNQWKRKGDFSYDLGAAIVRPLHGKYLADAVGYQGIWFNLARSERYLSGGYPADPPFSGGRLWVCKAPYGGVDTDERPATTGIGCDMTGGSSGGGWLIGLNRQGPGIGWLFGVNSYGIDDVNDIMYSPYFGNGAQQFWNYVKTQ